MPRVETVKIKADTEKGFRIINRSDFDPKKHQELEGKSVGPAKAKTAKTKAK